MSWKTLGRRILYPALWIPLGLTPLCAAGLLVLFRHGWQEHPAAPLLYALSAYTLTVLVLRGIRFFPARGRQLRQQIDRHPLGHRYREDPAFRTRLGLGASLGISLLHIGTNLLSGRSSGSVWFYLLAGYYGILSLMRALLLAYIRRHPDAGRPEAERRIARLCAGILLLTNLTLTGSVLMMLHLGRGFDHPGVLIYAVAAYTFYITIAAVRALLRGRRQHSAVLSMTRSIRLVAALVSMLALESAMLSRFGAETAEHSRQILIAATGGGICLIISSLSIHTIVRTIREDSRQRRSRSNESTR